MKIDFHAKTDIGLVRKTNEDSYGISEMLNLFIVADGMGGYEHGKEASRTVVNAIRSFIEEKCFSSQSVNEEIVQEAVSMANSAIQKKVKALQKVNTTTKMGSTLVLLVLKPTKCLLSNVGDSRIYLFRDNALYQKTKDHSLLQESTDQNINIADLSGNLKNVITRAIGVGEQVTPDFYYVPPREKDIFLLSSDGLHSLVSDREIEQIMTSSLSLHDAADRLVEKAKEKGGNDNITICLVKIKELSPKASPSDSTVSLATPQVENSENAVLEKITRQDWMIIFFIFIFLVLVSSFYYMMIFKI
ncbi:MAG: serine/threonine-protein phosphatase [Candidatus Aureabacteria bacterium]|nr:serine/threonine-protein phosphatase [Candidatus Auribacterota bacterium]